MKKEQRLLRLGILGCGPISQAAHFDATRKARNAELYAICDVADDLRDRMAAIHEPRKAFKDFDEMLADPQVEAVLIAVADQYHIPLALKAVAAGKHVLVEKPLGVAIEECEHLRAETKRCQEPLLFQIGHNRRFDPGVTFAQRFVREELGDLMAIKAWYCDSYWRYAMTDNLQPLPVGSRQIRRPEGDPKSDRRRYFMLGHGSHLVDVARFVGGEIASVRARLVEKFGQYCWFVMIEYANGAVGHLDLTIALRGDFTEGFQVYGEKGSVSCRMHLPWYHKTAEVECISIKDGIIRRPLGEDAYSYKRQIEGFADAVLHGTPQHGCNLDDGIASMRAMVAIARSVETGGTVKLADVTGAI